MVLSKYVLYSLVSVLCFGVVWCGVVWYDVVWCGVVWYGVVCYSMVWYGMLCYGGIYHYCVLNLSSDACERVADKLRKAGATVYSYKCDLTNKAMSTALPRKLKKKLVMWPYW